MIGVVWKRLFTALLPVLLATPASAQSDLFRGKTIEIYIGSATGGGYDFYGRLVARHLGAHLPGQPTVIAQNMPGAGSLRAANYVYNVAPKDGTALGIVTQTIAQEEALGTPGVQFHADKFNWIARVSPSIDISLTWHAAPVKNIEDAKRLEATVAGTGQGNIAEVMPRVLNAVVGTRFKVISGYEGANAGMLAMEKGEVDGAATSWSTLKVGKRDWLADKKIHLIVQYTPERTPELMDVPALIELGRSEEDRQVLALYASGAVVGRSFLAPPGVPADRIAILRSGFDAMMKDRGFLEEIERSKADFEPLSGVALQKIIEDSLKISPAVRERARAARGL